MTMTDPIADMLTRIRNANIAPVRHREDARLEAEGVAGRDPRARGLHRRLRRRAQPARPGTTLEITHEVLRRPHAHHRRDQARVQARPAHLRPGRRRCRACSAAWAWPCVSTSQGLMTDREARASARGRRGALLCLVARPAAGEGGLMSRIGRSPIAVPVRRHGRRSSGATSPSGPPGHPGARAPRGHHASARRATRSWSSRPDDERRAPRPARAHALARRQHGHGRHRGLRQGARDRRRRLPRHGQGPELARARARLLPPRPGRRARGHHLRGARRRRGSS